MFYKLYTFFPKQYKHNILPIKNILPQSTDAQLRPSTKDAAIIRWMPVDKPTDVLSDVLCGGAGGAITIHTQKTTEQLYISTIRLLIPNTLYLQVFFHKLIKCNILFFPSNTTTRFYRVTHFNIVNRLSRSCGRVQRTRPLSDGRQLSNQLLCWQLFLAVVVLFKNSNMYINCIFPYFIYQCNNNQGYFYIDITYQLSYIIRGERHG